IVQIIGASEHIAARGFAAGLAERREELHGGPRPPGHADLRIHEHPVHARLTKAGARGGLVAERRAPYLQVSVPVEATARDAALHEGALFLLVSRVVVVAQRAV